MVQRHERGALFIGFPLAHSFLAIRFGKKISFLNHDLECMNEVGTRNETPCMDTIQYPQYTMNW